MDLLTLLTGVLHLHTLPTHIPHIIAAFCFYHGLQDFISPTASRWAFPGIYKQLSTSSQINWNVHVVSMVQSCFIVGITLKVVILDLADADLEWTHRIYGYSKTVGTIQSCAAGYFLWDLSVSIRYFSILGLGSLLHAISALLVTILGFRPFANYYGLCFILYELSTPFLNIHWFLDKIGLTGSVFQLINGLALITTFAGCRLFWGVYQSTRIYRDIWLAMTVTLDNVPASSLDSNVLPVWDGYKTFETSTWSLSAATTIPTWLGLTYLISNTLLTVLNFFWFFKMIQALYKRFDNSDSVNKKLK